MAISERDTKKLYSYSAGLCNICKESVIDVVFDSFTQVGERCHIHGKREGAARFILQQENNDTYDNLILLCPRHHKMIDDMPEKFPVEYLLSIKHQHENSVRLNPHMHSLADSIIVRGIFQTYPLMFFVNLLNTINLNRIPLDILLPLEIENALKEYYEYDYPFQYPQLDYLTRSFFENFRNFKKYILDNMELYTVPQDIPFFIISDSIPEQTRLNIQSSWGLFQQSFLNWYSFCKSTYGC